MGISKVNIPDSIERSKARAKFLNDLGDKFHVGILIYSRQSALGNLYALCRMECSQDDKNSYFI